KGIMYDRRSLKNMVKNATSLPVGRHGLPAGRHGPVKRTVHFIGVGGIGMSALARWFLAQKWAVSGSDITLSNLTQALQKEGVKVKIGHKKAYVSPEMGLLVYNQAIPASNPELREARRRGIPVLTYPEALGVLSREYKTIAVSGAHGKSTTTAFLSLVLTRAGFDPTVILGTLFREFAGKNFRAGKSEYLVIEADEWKASFLNYSPTYAIITNIDREHLDFYKNYSNVKKTFLKFISNIREDGVLIANRDDKNLFALKRHIEKIAKRKNFRVIWYGAIINYSAYRKIRTFLEVPGKHNVSNALAVYVLARALGIKEEVILKALGRYRGAWRRMEYRGKLRIANSKSPLAISPVPVYDDYAHHPTEIKASLQAFREKFPKKEIICVFQPHQAHRTKNLFKEFISAFDLADYLILLPIYQVAGRDKSHKGYTSADLAKAIARSKNYKLKAKNSVSYLPSPKKLKSLLNSRFYFLDSAVVIMMGAGDIVNYTSLLIRGR
ncbi:MAG: UDP-N-acetylmuramate--L-alanine ligase, partial [Candidatus Jorgensenbacteria bacterium]